MELGTANNADFTSLPVWIRLVVLVWLVQVLLPNWLVHEEATCLLQTVLAIRHITEIAEDNLRLLFKLLVTRHTVLLMLPRSLALLTDKKYRVLLIVQVLLPIDCEGAALLEEWFYMIDLRNSLVSVSSLIFRVILLLEVVILKLLHEVIIVV